MYAAKLEIAGFKSFAQRTTLVFDRGVISVVGPNGSGKSNVADAIRWVLGEQSIKLLRGKKSEDVIFSGSSSRGRLGMAEVSLTLDNSDGAMPVDYREVCLTRRLYRSGEGEYLLNNTPVRLADIQLLLAKSNFGQRSYSVIGQGMVDHILAATPAERKAFFEEAAGVRQFQIKREAALHKLEQTKENLANAQLLMAEIEPHLRTLTRQVRRLEKRSGVEQELRDTQVRYYRLRRHELSAVRTELETKAKQEQTVASRHEADLSKLQKELETLERERSAGDVFNELQNEYSRLLEKKNGLMKEQVVLEGAKELEAAKSGELNVVWLENRVAELDRSIGSLQDELAMLKREGTQQQQRIAQRQAALDATAAEFAQLSANVSALKERFERAGFSLPDAARDVRVLREEFLTLKDLIASANSERDWKRAQGETTRLEERFAALASRFERADELPTAGDALLLHDLFVQLLKTKEAFTTEIHETTNLFERKTERIAVLEQSLRQLEEERQRAGRELERLSPKAGKSAATAKQRHDLEREVRELDTLLTALRGKITNFNHAEQQKKERLFALQKAFRQQQRELTDAASRYSGTRVELAKIETRLDDVLSELRAELPAELAEKVLAATTRPDGEVAEEKLLADIGNLKHQLELIGGIDENVTTEFKAADERYGFLSHQVNDLTASMSSLEQIITELDGKIKDQFHASFSAINAEFGKYFKALFNGGSAKLTLQEISQVVAEQEKEDEDDEDDEDEVPTANLGKKSEKILAGVDITAQPPGKRITGITMLSGGEKALTSIALICAILATRPSPFVVLDEVDAALDEANSQRFAAIVKELSKKSQFITISHNRATMQISSLLYGVTMNEDGVSKLLSIKMEDAAKVIEQHGNR